MTRLSRYKHECDVEGCGKITLINHGPRLVWFNYKDQSLCPKHFKELPQEDRDDADKLHSLLVNLSGIGLMASLEGKATDYTMSDEDKALLMKFDAFHTSETTGKTKVKIALGASRW